MDAKAKSRGVWKMTQLTVTGMLSIHVERVLEIEALSFPMPWSRQSFEFELTENEFAYYIVALVNQQVVGYAGAWLVLDEAHITNVAVHPDFRGKKIGRLLMTELIRRVLVKGALKMTLEVRLSNHIAQKLYQSLGFEPMGRRRRYYSDNNEDAIIMWKDLIEVK